MTQTDQKPTLDLSLPQVVAGAVAAAAATVLSSRLGLVGTVLGAVFASVVSAVVTASVAGWWHRAHHASRTARDWVPQRVRGVVVGAGALGLLVVAFHTGVELLTQDLPRGTFAARWLAEVGLTRG
jgi:hypothetical protein